MGLPKKDCPMETRPRLLLRVILGDHAASPRRGSPINVGIATMAKIVKRSIMLAGHKTSVSLEEGFWVALKEIAQRERISVSALVGRIDGRRDGNLSSAVRMYVLNDFRRGAGLPALPVQPSTPRACDPPAG
jgi:predicted DNA-binding ribbon-helix-helix protein